jgi:hypothetical protein
MLTKITLAATASLLLSAQAVQSAPTAAPQKLNAILCKDQALAWSTSWIAPFNGAQLERGA